MGITLVNVSSYSIIGAVVFGLLRKSRIDPVHIPFLILIWVGFTNEIISDISIKYFRTNAVCSNIYVFVEALLIVWQFKNWRLFSKNFPYLIISLSFILLWLWESLLYSSIHQFLSYFRICYSFIVVLMAIQMVNKLIITEQKSLLKNSCFLICSGFIFYFTFKVLVEIFWLYGLTASKEFGNRIYEISIYINIFTNLIFALAILWMPRKREFMLQS
ncbi:MAG: hypothetical protein JWP69_2046 [Flaviaesturariibacter sp.]|nr:hypothetical protein [Flaviaesturariibacter sp.]